ncbi:hypothetical protein [Streptomyces sp. NBC_00687]|uniref:hypothetical protein n=1 Tax=Streptomyces sp. NBC_00687 TaxID=2975807 RepID=UPI00224F3A97|nr:hypothetical protein [Streptomyces sp. NBC_00687]MCX4920224.1 hypothetical protein [Streptomyces sp. NBC_00687]
MIKILSRAVSVAAVAGFAAFAAANPAFAAPEPGGLIGDQLGVIDVASQNSGVNNGNHQGTASHSQNTQNSAQQIVTDAQSIEVLKEVQTAEKPLILG